MEYCLERKIAEWDRSDDPSHGEWTLYYIRSYISLHKQRMTHDNVFTFGADKEMHGPKEGRKEGNVLFNHALNTFYLQLYGVGHMVKDHSDSERGNLLPLHGLLFPIDSNCTIPDMIAHTTTFVTPVVEHWLERETAQWVHPMKDRSDDPSQYERTLLPQSYISLWLEREIAQ